MSSSYKSLESALEGHYGHHERVWEQPEPSAALLRLSVTAWGASFRSVKTPLPALAALLLQLLDLALQRSNLRLLSLHFIQQ